MLKIKEVTSFEADAVHYTDMDGFPAAYLRPTVVAIAVDGTHWHLPNPVRFEYGEDGEGPVPQARFDIFKAHEIRARIEANGFIEERHWLTFKPDTRSYEERWEDNNYEDLEREYEEKTGQRPEGGNLYL